MDMAKRKEIAATILRQMGGTGRLVAMTGAKDFCAHESGVSFNFKGSKVANYIKVILNSMDTYDVEFGKIRGYTYRVAKEMSGLHFDQLKEQFEEVTGLHLTL